MSSKSGPLKRYNIFDKHLGRFFVIFSKKQYSIIRLSPRVGFKAVFIRGISLLATGLPPPLPFLPPPPLLLPLPCSSSSQVGRPVGWCRKRGREEEGLCNEEERGAKNRAPPSSQHGHSHRVHCTYTVQYTRITLRRPSDRASKKKPQSPLAPSFPSFSHFLLFPFPFSMVAFGFFSGAGKVTTISNSEKPDWIFNQFQSFPPPSSPP